MSIKEEIKKELLKLLEEEYKNISQQYSELQYCKFMINDGYSRKTAIALENEIMFIKKLKVFADSI